MEAKSRPDSDEIRNKLLGIPTAAVGNLDSDKLSKESFSSLRAVLQIGLEVVRDSRTVLEPAGR